MISRELEKKLKFAMRKFPIVALVGPRQSGKTTLAKNLFPKKPYVSLENPDIRERAETDPRSFLASFPKGAILDEAQRVPPLFSYLQEVVDKSNKSGQFILTGSQNFLLMDKVTQSLAGRVSIQRLLPFSTKEISQIGPNISLENLLFQGAYPRIYDKKLSPADYYPNYIATYLERDVRQIKNIGNLSVFQRFLKMCAAQTGQLLNLSSLANDCGVTHKTIRAWISVLEASFIVFLLQPHHANFKKRLVKMPKLYFFDTGLAASLLGIENAAQIGAHPLRGALFETFVVSELVKTRTNKGLQSNLFFWRDKTGHEVDVVIDRGSHLVPVEIKSGKTLSSDSYKNLAYWSQLARQKNDGGFLIYAGVEQFTHQSIRILNWKNISSIPTT